MSATEREEQSNAVCRSVSGIPAWQQAAVVVGYMATKEEVDIVPLLAAACAEGKRVIIPAVTAGAIVWREIRDVSSAQEVKTGVFGIREPAESCPAWNPHEETGLIVWLIPGVGFDRSGRRLGRGGGYYDRALSQAAVKEGLIGLGFTCQLIDMVPAGERDWRMNWIITPDKWIEVQGNNT